MSEIHHNSNGNSGPGSIRSRALFSIAVLLVFGTLLNWFLPRDDATPSAVEFSGGSNLSDFPTDGVALIEGLSAPSDVGLLPSTEEGRMPVQPSAQSTARKGKFRLEVRAAGSGAHVDEVFLAPVRNQRPSHLLPPSLEARIVEPSLLGPSPITISPSVLGRDFWVGGPWLAWQRVALNPTANSLQVTLQPAGTLMLTEIPKGFRNPALVRVASMDTGLTVLHSSLAKSPLKDNMSLELPGLEVGTYSIEFGIAGRTEPFSQASVGVAAGERVDFPLSRLWQPGDPSLVPVHLVIGLPCELELLEILSGEAPQIGLRPVDAAAVRNGARPHYRLDPDRTRLEGLGVRDLGFRIRPGIPRGEYSVTLRPLGWIGSLQVDQETVSRIDVPELAEARISILDENSRAVDVKHLQLMRVHSEGRIPGHAFRDSDGVWRALGLPGDWTLTASGPSFMSASIDVAAIEGGNDFSIRVQPVFQCALTLRRDGRVLSRSLDWWEQMKVLDSQGRLLDRALIFEEIQVSSMESARVVVQSSLDGEVRIQLPPYEQGAQAIEQAISLSPVEVSASVALQVGSE